MSSFSIEYLAELGRQRAISPMLERAWMNNGGSNPVATAMRIVENKRKGRNRRCLKIAILFTIAALCVAVVGVAVYTVSGDIRAMSGCLAIVAFLIGAFLEISLAHETKGEEVSEEAKSNVIGFCGHLSLISDQWADHNHRGFYRYIDDDRVRRVGTDILVRSADCVLQVQKNQKGATSREEKERCEVSAANEMTEFAKRYNTLQRVGLASGGHKKYFDIARRLPKQTQQTAATSLPSPALLEV